MRFEDATVPQADAGTAAIAAELGAQTPLLERIHRALVRQPAVRAEDTQTFAFATGAYGAYVFSPAVPAVGGVEVSAWQSGLTGQPFVVLDGRLTPDQTEALVGIGAQGFVPVLFTVPSGDVARVRITRYSGHLTIASVGNPTAQTLVSVRVRACR